MKTGLETKLWVPGDSLEAEYPEATPEELKSVLATCFERENVRTASVDGVLGAIRVPEPGEVVNGIISFDCCEVVRKTGRGVVKVLNPVKPVGVYESAPWFEERDEMYRQIAVDATVRSLTNNDRVRPVEGIEEIAAMMNKWRTEHGVFIVANTSIVSGCEVATINQLNKYLPGGFDGIVFPRNHTGEGKLKKVHAFGHVIDTLGSMGHTPQFGSHIDDMAHHITPMFEGLPQLERSRHFHVDYSEEAIALGGLKRELLKAIERPRMLGEGAGFEINSAQVERALETLRMPVEERNPSSFVNDERVSFAHTPLDTFRLMNDYVQQEMQGAGNKVT